MFKLTLLFPACPGGDHRTSEYVVLGNGLRALIVSDPIGLVAHALVFLWSTCNGIGRK